ncbi:MAG: hypothetical protein AABY92_01370, partial [Thermodesulfobacteriota bacterium]
IFCPDPRQAKNNSKDDRIIIHGIFYQQEMGCRIDGTDAVLPVASTTATRPPSGSSRGRMPPK